MGWWEGWSPLCCPFWAVAPRRPCSRADCVPESTGKCMCILSFAWKNSVLWNELSKIQPNSSVFMASGWCWLGHKYLTAFRYETSLTHGHAGACLGGGGCLHSRHCKPAQLPAIWTCCFLPTVNLFLPVADLYLNFPAIFNVNSLCSVLQSGVWRLVPGLALASEYPNGIFWSFLQRVWKNSSFFISFYLKIVKDNAIWSQH